MLSINFYAANGIENESVDVSEGFYTWLAQSEFSKVAEAQSTPLELEDEIVPLPLVKLLPEVREGYIQFLSDAIVEGTRKIINHLEPPYLTNELETEKYWLRKLLELLDRIKHEGYQYIGYY